LTTAYDAPHDELEGPYWNKTRLGLVVVVVLIIAMWVWIYVFAPRTNPDRLTNREFVTQAETLCAPYAQQILDIPPGNTATTPAERARQVELGTDITREMIEALEVAAAQVTDPDEVEILEAWFVDWRAYVADREAHIVRLESATADSSARDLAFTLTERASGGFYTRRIDGLANVNGMTSCRVPEDV